MQSPLFDDPRAAEAWADEIFDQSMTDQNHPYYNCNGWSSTYVEFSDGSTKYMMVENKVYLFLCNHLYLMIQGLLKHGPINSLVLWMKVVHIII